MKITLTYNMSELRELVAEAVEARFPCKKVSGIAFKAQQARSYMSDEPLGFSEVTGCEVDIMEVPDGQSEV